MGTWARLKLGYLLNTSAGFEVFMAASTFKAPEDGCIKVL